MPRRLSSAKDLLLAIAVTPGLALTTGLLSLANLPLRVRRGVPSPDPVPDATAATVVIAVDGVDEPLRRCLKSVNEAVKFDGAQHQVILVGIETDEVKLLMAAECPGAELLSAGRSDMRDRWQAGIQAARHDVVVTLRADAVVDKGFLRPLLASFADPMVFAVAPIRREGNMEAPTAPRGRTRGYLHNGEIHLWEDRRVTELDTSEVILWASLGEAAYDKAKLTCLRGLRRLYADGSTADVDLCLQAWRRDWRVYLKPQSVLDHPAEDEREKTFSPDLAEMDRILFHWGNLSSPGELLLYQLSLIIGLFTRAQEGQLNLRPLRYAWSTLPSLIRYSLTPSTPPKLSEREALQRSFHRFFRNQLERNRGDNSPVEAPHKLESPMEDLELRTETLRILLICPQLPYPPSHGAAVRMWNLLKALGSHHQVDLLSFAEPSLSPEEIAASVAALRRYCRDVRVVIRKPQDFPSSLLDRSIHIEQFDCPEMRTELLDMVEQNCYDVIQFDKIELGQYALSQPAPVQVLIEHVVFYHAYKRQFLTRDRISVHHLVEYLKLRHHELQVSHHFDGIITMSDVDTEFLRRRLPSHPCIADVPNGVDTDYYRYAQHPADSHDLLFIGNFEHSPNVDGVRFFLREVFPLIKASVPNVRLFIVGPGPYRTVPEVAAEPRVIATGFVEDTRPYMERCSVFVAPILAGSGTRLKILEAMSAGIPIVSTSLGAEGLGAESGVHLLLADKPTDFAKAVVTLMEYPELRHRLMENARGLVEDRFGWSRVWERLEDVYRGLVAAKRQNRPQPR